jgi:hypothetical protein
MKKLILFTLLLIGIISIAQSKHVYIHKENGGVFGYDKVTVIQNGADLWIDCCNRGYSRCRGLTKPSPDGDLDAVDIEQMYGLIDQADELIGGGQMEGARTVRVHVDGETFDRLYRVTWHGADEFNTEIHSERLNDISL